TTLNELADDARLWATLSVHTSITQLKSAIRDAENEAGPLIAALERTGFGDRSAEPAAGLWNAFVSATPMSMPPGLPSPWRLIHEFGLRLSNRAEAGAAVVALIEGLIKYGESTAGPPNMLPELRGNLHFMRSFMGDETTLESPAANVVVTKPSRITRLSKAISRTFRRTPRSQLSGDQIRDDGGGVVTSHKISWRKPLLGAGMMAALALCVPAFYFGFGRLPLLSAATGRSVASHGAEAMPQ